MNVTKRNGDIVPFDKDKIKKFVQRACEGVESVNTDTLLYNASIKLYDGVKTTEIDQSLIRSARALYEAQPNYSLVASRMLSATVYKDFCDSIDKENIRGTKEELIRTLFESSLNHLIENDIVNKRLASTHFDMGTIVEAIKIERDDLIPYAGAQTLTDRYIHRVNGKCSETIQTMWMRISMGLALGEAPLDSTTKSSRKKRTEWAIKFYDTISQRLYMPSTPTLFNSGSVRNQLSSCFLSTFEDSLEGIYDGAHQQAQLSKYQGGLGMDVTPFRADGQMINSMNGKTQGAVYFWKLFNDTLVAVNQGGKRRGSGCAYLENWHAEFRDFLQLKKNTGDERRRTHDMNTAAWISDLFMKRVLKNEEWSFFSPEEVPELHETYGIEFEEHYKRYEEKGRNGDLQCYSTMPAKDLWKEHLKSLFETGAPWVTFKDPCNSRYANNHYGVVHSSNLCTEITLSTKPTRYSKNNKRQITEYGETAVCNLGSIVLSNHLKVDESGKTVIDYELLKETISIGSRMLDNVIDINFYPTYEAGISNRKHRPVGMGSMGWADLFMELDFDYSSDESITLSDNLYEFISMQTILANTRLAKERGKYETYKGSLWDQGVFPIDSYVKQMNETKGNIVVEEDNSIQFDSNTVTETLSVESQCSLDWTEVREQVAKYGMRNSVTMAIAPNATIARVVGTSPCTEPYFSLKYVESTLSGEFTVINKHFVKDCIDNRIWNETMVNLVKETDGCIDELAKRLPNNDVIQKLVSKYKSSFAIGAYHMIDQAAAKGKWIDQAYSLNLFYRGKSLKELNNIYQRAFARGLKTTYYLRCEGASNVEKSGAKISDADVSALDRGAVAIACSLDNPGACEMCD